MEDRRSYRDRRKSDRFNLDAGELFVVFRCADYQFVIANSDILSVTAQPRLVPIPRSQPWFAGVASVDGYTTSVTDLCAYLGLQAAQGKAHARLLLLKHNEHYIGLLVDAVVGVMECQPCERSRAFYPLEVEQFMISQRCADGQCYDEFDVRRLLNERRFYDAVESVSPSSLVGAP